MDLRLTSRQRLAAAHVVDRAGDENHLRQKHDRPGYVPRRADVL